MLRIVDVDGTYDSKLEPQLPPDLLQTAYRHLVLVRTLDTRMLSLQRQGRIGFYVPSTGEEACQIAGRSGSSKKHQSSTRNRKASHYCVLVKWNHCSMTPLDRVACQ